MQGKKNLLAKILYRSRLTKLVNKLSGQRLFIITYHRIKGNDLTETLFDDGVYGLSANQFEDQMIWLKENTEILTESEAIDYIYNRRLLVAPSTLITFDDAYIDNYTIAFPIIKRLGIPAIFFVATKLINERTMGWWDIIAYILKQTSIQQANSDGLSINLGASRQQSINMLLREIKLGKHVEIDMMLARLAELCGVNLPGHDIQSKELMTWDQIREVSKNGIAIGSHTHSHRILATLTASEQEAELKGSKNILEHELGHKIRSISYPVGNSYCFTDETESIARECGYEVAFSYKLEANNLCHTSPYNTKRICAPQSDRTVLASTLAFPKLFTGNSFIWY